MSPWTLQSVANKLSCKVTDESAEMFCVCERAVLTNQLLQSQTSKPRAQPGLSAKNLDKCSRHPELKQPVYQKAPRQIEGAATDSHKASDNYRGAAALLDPGGFAGIRLKASLVFLRTNPRHELLLVCGGRNNTPVFLVLNNGCRDLT